MTDEGPLYVSQVVFDKQKQLLSFGDAELLDQMADIVIQICVRQRMRPRDLFEMILDAREDYLDTVIPAMSEALQGGESLPADAAGRGRDQAVALGIDIDELAYETVVGINDHVPARPDGLPHVFPVDVIGRLCRSRLILAAGLATPEFEDAVEAAGAASDDILPEAEARLDSLQAYVLKTHHLDAAARLLTDLIITSDRGQAQ